MLTLSKVTQRYTDGTIAIDSLSLELQQGMIGLLGPNGAGKSTLMRILAGLQKPSDGELFFKGFNVLKHPLRLRRQLGYLPQYFGVYPHMGCYALLEHIAILKGIDKKLRRQQIIDLMEKTNLSSVANKPVIHFSGGMKQRFGVAQALLGSPKLIILDEPTAGLDPLERTHFNELLLSISKNRLIIFSTHIVEDIENLCRRVVILKNGKLVNEGNIHTLLLTLHKKVWQLPRLPNDIQTHNILSKNFHRGEMTYRVFSNQSPSENAIPVLPNLHDAYCYRMNTTR